MFRLGDKVIVKRWGGFSDSVIMGGWTGICLYDQRSNSVGSLVHVVWDGVTLDRMPPVYLDYCQKYRINHRFHIVPVSQLCHDRGSGSRKRQSHV